MGGVIVAVAGSTGCAGDDPADAPPPAGTSPSTASEAPTPQDSTTDPSDPSPDPTETAAAGVVLEITLADGEVNPAGQQVEAVVGEPIELHVDSDITEELHLHLAPDRYFDVEPTDGQVFTFTIDQPGQVELETHGSGVLVAQLVVRP